MGANLEEVIWIHPPQGHFSYAPNLEPIEPVIINHDFVENRTAFEKFSFQPEGILTQLVQNFNDFVISVGFVVFSVDRQIIRFQVQTHCIVITRVILNMDDLVTSDIDGFTVETQHLMKNRFRMHNLRNVTFHVGMNSNSIRNSWQSTTISTATFGPSWRCSALLGPALLPWSYQ